MEEIIRFAEEAATSGRILSKNEIVALLALPDEQYEELGSAARRVSAAKTGNRAYLWAAIGVDFAPCAMNCAFCSLGEEWGLTKRQEKFTEEEIIRLVHGFNAAGVRWIVLRTTEYYDLKDLAELAQKIRGRVPGPYELGLNVGEFDLETAKMLKRSGIDFIYHSLRLGEGRDTHFDPQERLSTLEAVKNSPLDLVYLVEPIGPEHSNEEIADIILSAIHYGAKVSGAMARVPVKGTPLGNIPQLTNRRLAQITAVTRLAGGNSTLNICSHPPTQEAVRSGANVLVVETGSIPRDGSYAEADWNGFTPQDARRMFEENGFWMCQGPE